MKREERAQRNGEGERREKQTDRKRNGGRVVFWELTLSLLINFIIP